MTGFFKMAPFAILLLFLPVPGTVALRLLCLAAAFLFAVWSLRTNSVPALPIKGIFCAWVAVSISSLAYALDPAYSLGEIKNEVGYTAMAFFSYFVFTNSMFRLKFLISTLGVGVFGICVSAIIARMTLGEWDSAGIHGGTASFASYVVAATPCLFLAVAGFGGRRWVWAAAVVFMCAIVASFYSLQRIIWVSLLAQAAVALTLLWRSKLLDLSFRRLAAYIVAGAVLCAGIFTATQLTRTQSVQLAVLGSDVRLEQWPNVVDRILQTPLSGAGFGRGAMSKLHRDLTPSDSPYFWHAHNVFLNYGLATGLPGVVVLALLFAALTRRYWRYCSADSMIVRIIGVTGCMLVVGIVVRNQVNDMFVRDQAILFWALNGMLLGLGERLFRDERISR